MAKKLPEMEQPGLGDVTDVLHNQGVSDLSWLAIDPEEYRKFEALPQQNLDTIPELQEALAFDGTDERVPARIPMRSLPVVNQNPSDLTPPALRSQVSVVNRLASYVIAGLPEDAIRTRLLSEFSPDQLRAASQEASGILSERGLLGSVYVNSSHFPRCAQEGAHRQFVAKAASGASFVLAKSDCRGCVHNRGGICASFHKRLVSEVPYGDKTFAHYATRLAAEGRLDPAAPSSSDQERKDALRSAFLRPRSAPREAGVQRSWTQKVPVPVPVTDQDLASYAERRAASSAAVPMPGPMFLVASRKVMSGAADQVSLAASSDPDVRKLAGEVGLLGHTYLDGDALGGASAALKLLSGKASLPDCVVLRSASGEDSRAMVELAKLVQILPSVPEIGQGHFANACARAVREGRLAQSQADSAVANAGPASDFRSLTAQANLFSPPSPSQEAHVQTAPSGSFHYGDPGRGLQASAMDPEEVRMTISGMMNRGLSGKLLVAGILKRYSKSDLAQVPDIGARLAAEDGIQGSYFVDPTAYPDYGRGCASGSKELRRSQVPYLLASSSCTGCSYQTHPGWCSKYAKDMIRQVPDSVRTEVAAHRHLPVATSPLAVENPVEKYGLATELSVEPAASAAPGPDISVSARSVTE